MKFKMLWSHSNEFACLIGAITITNRLMTNNAGNIRNEGVGNKRSKNKFAKNGK